MAQHQLHLSRSHETELVKVIENRPSHRPARQSVPWPLTECRRRDDAQPVPQHLRPLIQVKLIAKPTILPARRTPIQTPFLPPGPYPSGRWVARHGQELNTEAPRTGFPVVPMRFWKAVFGHQDRSLPQLPKEFRWRAEKPYVGIHIRDPLGRGVPLKNGIKGKRRKGPAILPTISARLDRTQRLILDFNERKRHQTWKIKPNQGLMAGSVHTDNPQPKRVGVPMEGSMEGQPHRQVIAVENGHEVFTCHTRLHHRGTTGRTFMRNGFGGRSDIVPRVS